MQFFRACPVDRCWFGPPYSVAHQVSTDQNSSVRNEFQREDSGNGWLRIHRNGGIIAYVSDLQ